MDQHLSVKQLWLSALCCCWEASVSYDHTGHPDRLIPVLIPVMRSYTTTDMAVQQHLVSCQWGLPIAAGRTLSRIVFVISITASCTDGSQSSTNKPMHAFFSTFFTVVSFFFQENLIFFILHRALHR